SGTGLVLMIAQRRNSRMCRRKPNQVPNCLSRFFAGESHVVLFVHKLICRIVQRHEPASDGRLDVPHVSESTARWIEAIEHLTATAVLQLRPEAVPKEPLPLRVRPELLVVELDDRQNPDRQPANGAFGGIR